jgi:broad specificity phosphatase PhoE
MEMLQIMQETCEWGEVGGESWKDFLDRVALDLGKVYKAQDRRLLESRMEAE